MKHSVRKFTGDRSSYKSTHVVLVNEDDKIIKTMDKMEVHHQNTPLHRGFSVFIFNEKNELLLTKRSSKKKTWPGFWSNSYCGHPQMDESYIDAACRGAIFELGIILETSMLKKLSDYQYRFEYQNVVENEICPIFVCEVTISNDTLNINPDEIEDFKWIKWNDFLNSLKEEEYTPWCKEEAMIINKLTELV